MEQVPDVEKSEAEDNGNHCDSLIHMSHVTLFYPIQRHCCIILSPSLLSIETFLFIVLHHFASLAGYDERTFQRHKFNVNPLGMPNGRILHYRLLLLIERRVTVRRLKESGYQSVRYRLSSARKNTAGKLRNWHVTSSMASFIFSPHQPQKLETTNNRNFFPQRENLNIQTT